MLASTSTLEPSGTAAKIPGKEAHVIGGPGRSLPRFEPAVPPRAGVGLSHFVARWLCRHRRARPCRWIGQLAYLVWRAYENRDFEPATNGEAWCLQRLASLRPCATCAFDVGANQGDWLLACRRWLPTATIHAFEIVPDIFARLQTRLRDIERVVLNPYGLSEHPGTVEVHRATEADYRSSLFAEHLDVSFDMPGGKPLSSEAVVSQVKCGDDYAREHGIHTIDFLKIDVEGMEGHVLRGFDELLSNHRIRTIQFEYNTTSIVSKFLLRDAYRFFAARRYRVGKLYPTYVDFRQYHYRHEDFCGPNFIAIREEDATLLKLLA